MWGDRASGHAARGYLDQPGLQLVVDDDVIAVALKAVFVVVHHRLQGEDRWVTEPELGGPAETHIMEMRDVKAAGPSSRW